MRWSRTITFLLFAFFDFGGAEPEGEPEPLDTDERSKAALANYKGDRSEPIDIQLSFPVREKKVVALIRNGDGDGEKATLINTGNSVEVRLAQSETSLYVSGPAVANYLFVYTRTIFYWADSLDGVAGTTIRGKNGTALEISVIFYNTKYETYFKALKHRDGILEVRHRVNANSKQDNENFNSFAEKMIEIENPGSTEIEMKEHNAWYLNFAPTPYYAYPGSVRNESTGRTFNCSIVVVIDKLIGISSKQFEKTFLNEKKTDGTQLITKQAQRKQGSRPVVHAPDRVFIKSLNEGGPIHSEEGSSGT